MLVVIPVYRKDADLALANLKWAAQLDGKTRHTALVTCEDTFDASRVIEAAQQFFAETTVFRYETLPLGARWPRNSNVAWQRTALHIGEAMPPTHWLWWEADATPCRAGWLDDIDRAYLACGHPLMGYRVADDGHMNGVGVYPHQVYAFSQNSFLVREVPFDRALTRDAGTEAIADSPLFGHYLKPVGGGEGRHFVSIDEVDREWAIYHGCTDGSLLNVLGASAEPQQAQVSLFTWLSSRSSEPAPEQPKKLVAWYTMRPPPRIVHCVALYHSPDPEVQRRVLAAWHSWMPFYRSGLAVPAHVWEWDYPRTSNALGDHRGLPYLKDVLAIGMTRADDDDVLVLTNDDTVWHSALADRLIEQMTRSAACSSFRVNYPPGDTPALDAPVTELRRFFGPDIGRDLFCFRKDWLREKWHQIPDMLLGEFEWDLVLAYLIRLENGVKTTTNNRAEVVDSSEMPKGYVLHESHDHSRTWMQMPEDNPAKAHNHKLCEAWLKAHDMESLLYG